MTDLRNFFGRGARVGTMETLWAKFGFFFEIGSGEFTAFDSRFVHFQGSVDTLSYRGPVNLQLRLTRERACSISVNGATDHHASYSLSGDALIIHAILGGKLQHISLSQGGSDGSETCVSLLGTCTLELALTPAPALAVAMAA